VTLSDQLGLLQAKGGDAGHAARGCLDHTPVRKVVFLNAQIDLAVSWQPQFKETVLQGCDGSIEQDASFLVNSLYLESLVSQFPLTGGKIMNRSRMRLGNVGSDCDQHFVCRHRDRFDLSVGKLEMDLLGVNADRNIPFRPSPLIGKCHGLNGINVFQFGHECFLVGMEGPR
jgi:hypothetical protein